MMQCMAPTSDTTSIGTCTSESRSVTDMRGSIAGTAMLTAGCKPRACFAGRVEEGSELRLPVALLFALIFALLFSLCRRATYAAQERMWDSALDSWSRAVRAHLFHGSLEGGSLQRAILTGLVRPGKEPRREEHGVATRQ